jgi:hypothetical protein
MPMTAQQPRSRQPKNLRSARDFAWEEWPLRGSVADVLR